MITLTTTPPEISFAGNPVLFKVHSNRLVATPGVTCAFNLLVYAADTVAGHTISFAFPDCTVTLTNSTTPDDSGTQIQKASNSSLWSAYAQTIYDVCKTNFILSTRFNIAIMAPGTSARAIVFQAKKAGTANSATVVSTLVTVNLSGFIAGVNAINRNSFSIIGGIWDADGRQLVEDNKPVDANSDAIFNFSEYLSILLDLHKTPYFTFPFDSAHVIKTFHYYVLPYRVGFAERYEGAVKQLTFDSLRYAVPGGLNRETILAYNDLGEPFFTCAENQISFLTWAPDFKLTSKLVPEILFFYIPPSSAFSLVRINVTVYFTDDSQSSFVTSEYEVSPNDVVELSVGYSALDLAAVNPLKTIAAWSVCLQKVTDGGIVDAPDWVYTDISEVRTFLLDPAAFENERIFIFQNSFAKAYDVVRFTGKGSMSIDLDFATSTTDSSDTVTFYNASNNKFSASELQRNTANSGWITKEVKNYLRDLMLSKQVFEYKDGLLYPVIITSDKIKEHFVDNVYLYNLDIEYDRAYRDFFFQFSE
jgi:hypothetical protein